MKQYDFASKISTCLVEKDVENIYRECISYYLGSSSISITSPYGCDGYVKAVDNSLLFDISQEGYRLSNLKRLKVLLEFKFDRNFESAYERAKVILQSLFYLKRFEMDGNDINQPNVIFVGDINEMFALHFNDVQKYLDLEIDWTVAPSEAYSKFPDVVQKISSDSDVSPYVVKVSNDGIREMISFIQKLNNRIKPHIRITEHNIARVFDDFYTNVLDPRSKQIYNPEILVGTFIGSISNPTEFYLHPKKRSMLVTPATEIPVRSTRFRSFFSYFKGDNYTVTEKRRFTEIQDRLIEDLSRRRSGEFFTPTLWADQAVTMLDESMPNWRTESIVWDCAAGTKNLTRDHKFNNLFSSTLYASDLDVSSGYNPNGSSFQYDFLNDGVNTFIDHDDEKIPKKLRDAINDDSSLIFYINPPYGAATSEGAKGDGSKKKGMSKTRVNEFMKLRKTYGSASQQLFAQFLARIIDLVDQKNLNSCCIGLFCTPIFLSGSSYQKFRSEFLSRFRFVKGMLFQASNFSDVDSNWGISFSVWNLDRTSAQRNRFVHTLMHDTDGAIISLGSKTIYNTDSLTDGSSWAKGNFEKKYRKRKIDFPQLTSAINVSQKGIGKWVEGALGFYNNGGNNIAQSENDVGIFSSAYKNGHGYPIMEEYCDNILANFIARRIGFMNETWINQKDEFLMPNISHGQYSQYLEDAHVLTIFNPKAKVSSLRNVHYKGKTYDITNQFFFVSEEICRAAIDSAGLLEMYEDIQGYPGERYMVRRIRPELLSSDCAVILNTAVSLYKKSLPYRKTLSEELPDYNLMAWDAGWFQIKAVLDVYFKEELNSFELAVNTALRSRTDLIYDLEFLVN